jgi:hypothetical protein
MEGSGERIPERRTWRIGEVTGQIYIAPQVLTRFLGNFFLQGWTKAPSCNVLSL